MTNVSKFKEYKDIVMKLLNDVNPDEIDKGANLLVNAVKKDKLIYVIGTDGHDYMAAEEMFLKAGGLLNIHPIFPSGLALSHGGLRSNIFERCQGYISGVLDYYAPLKENVLIIVSSCGINSSAIEAAVKGKKHGANILAITSTEFSKYIPANHPARDPSGKNLCDLEQVDVIIDNKVPKGDAILSFNDLDVKVSSVSTILNGFILNSLVATAVEKLLNEGIIPDIWKNINLPGADEYNKKYIKKYSNRIKRF